MSENFTIVDGVLEDYVGDAAHVVIPEGVTAIGDFAFSNCEMVSVVIPEGVTEIEAEAFQHCSALKEVVIPESLIWVDCSAFNDCPSDIVFKKADGSKVVISDYFNEPFEINAQDDEVAAITFRLNAVKEGTLKRMLGLVVDLGFDLSLQGQSAVKNEDETPEEWRIFEIVDDDDRISALDTHFEFDGGADVFGWARPTVFLNGERRTYRISCIGSSVGDFRDAVNDLADGETLRFFWLDEPGCYKWYISRQGDYVYVEPPLFDNGAYMYYEAFREAVEAGGCDYWT